MVSLIQIATPHKNLSSLQGHASQKSIATSDTNRKFGSILAMKNSDGGLSQPVNEEASGSVETLMAQLLDITSIADLEHFLQENGLAQLGNLEVMSGTLRLSEYMVDLLQQLLPELQQIIDSIEHPDEMRQLELRSILQIVEASLEHLLQGKEVAEVVAEIPAEQLLAYLSVMQVLTIETQKMDLTLTDEHRMHTVQQMMESFTGHLQNKEQTSAHQNGFASTKEQSTTKQAHVLTGQITHPLFTTSNIEFSRWTGEVENNSRAEQLMKELQQIFKRANFGQTGGTNRISIRLYPEHLGQLRIELLQTNGVLTARILASNVLGKEMLESQLHQLRQAFLQQSIQVERIDISQMMTQTPDAHRDRAFNQHFKQEQHENRQDQEDLQDPEEMMSFEEYMIALEG